MALQRISEKQQPEMEGNSVKVRDASSQGDSSNKVVGDAELLIGNGNGFNTEVISGDATMSNGGALTIANNAINADKLADNAVDTAALVDLNVTTGKLAQGAVTNAKMAANSVDSDQYVDGSIERVHLAADAIDGSKIDDDAVDSEHIADGAIDLAHMSANSVDSDQYVDGSIDTAHIADAQITLAKMAANSVDSDQYVDGSIDLAHMSANSVDSDQYVDGSVDNVHLAGSITADKLNNAIFEDLETLGPVGGDGEILVGSGAGVFAYESGNTARTSLGLGTGDSPQFTSLVLTGDLQVDGDIERRNATELMIADLTIECAGDAANAAQADSAGFKIGGIDATLLWDNGNSRLNLSHKLNSDNGFRGDLEGNADSATVLETARTIAMTGDVVWNSGDFNGSANVTAGATIQADAVTTSKILDANVTTAKLADLNVTTGKLAAVSVTTAKLADSAVTSLKLGDAQVLTAKLADSAVTTAKLGDAQVTLAKMAANSVDSDQYVDGSIDRIHLAADAIDGSKLDDDAVDSEHIAAGAIDPEHFDSACFGAGLMSDSGKFRLNILRDDFLGSAGDDDLNLQNSNGGTVNTVAFGALQAAAVLSAGSGNFADKPDPGNFLMVFVNGMLQQVEITNTASGKGNDRLESGAIDCLLDINSRKIFFMEGDIDDADMVTVSYMAD